MTDQLISLEIFNLAREKGFIWNVLTEYTKRPTQSLLQKWLREKHNLCVMPFLGGYKIFKYGYHIHKLESKDAFKEAETRIFHRAHFNTYEYALEAGLKKTLKLIP